MSAAPTGVAGVAKGGGVPGGATIGPVTAIGPAYGTATGIRGSVVVPTLGTSPVVTPSARPSASDSSLADWNRAAGSRAAAFARLNKLLVCDAICCAQDADDAGNASPRSGTKWISAAMRECTRRASATTRSACASSLRSA